MKSVMVLPDEKGESLFIKDDIVTLSYSTESDDKIPVDLIIEGRIKSIGSDSLTLDIAERFNSKEIELSIDRINSIQYLSDESTKESNKETLPDNEKRLGLEAIGLGAIGFKYRDDESEEKTAQEEQVETSETIETTE